jgi:outer membrane protein OmpA-like peptidoglycan-associated protein
MKREKFLLLNKKYFYILAIFILFGSVSVSSTGLSGADFLTWNIGAAPAAMAGAYSSIARGIYSISFNPAGISLKRENLLGFSHLQLFSDTKMENFLYVFPGAFNGTFGISFLYSNTKFDWIDIYGNISPLSIYNMSFNLTYGKKIFDHIHFGISLKGFQRKFDEATSEGSGIDIGLLAESFNKRLTYGIVIQNLGYQTAFYEISDPMPTIIKAGMNFNFNISKDIFITIAGDVNKNLNENIDEMNEMLGAELNFFHLLFLRSGYSFQNDDNHLSAGLGVRLFGFNVDYAFTYNRFLGNIHYFTLIINMNSVFSKDNGQETTKKKKDEKKLNGIKEDLPVKNKERKPQKEIQSIFIKTKFLIYFDINKYKLSENDRQKLDEFILIIKNISYNKILINGYSDITGKKLYNIVIGKRRAERIKNYLIKMGIDKNKIFVTSYGIKNPIGNNDMESGKRKNRRAEIIIEY